MYKVKKYVKSKIFDNEKKIIYKILCDEKINFVEKKLLNRYKKV
jgi:hypothetical protein